MNDDKDTTARPGQQAHSKALTSQGPPIDVKDLGRKARARLAHERSKRAEIVRISPDEATLLEKQQQQDKQQTTIKSGSNKRSIRDNSLNEKKSSRKRGRGQTKGSYTFPENADMWMPDISHLPRYSSKEKRSSLVRLHGLPCGTNALQIKKFFSGLEIQSIAVLLSCDATIAEWDAIEEVNKDTSRSKLCHQRLSPLVKRHSPRFRVVVKFDSAPTAELAVDRSGETINVVKEQNTVTGGNPSQVSIVRASVGVSLVLKPDDTLILQSLAIDAISSDATPRAIYEIGTSVEKNLLPDVDRILWMDAQFQLKLTFKTPHQWRRNFKETHNSIEDDRQNQKYLEAPEALNSILNPPSHETVEALTRQREILFEARRQMLEASPFPSTELLDPVLGEDDPALRLACQACRVLRKRSRLIDEKLLEIHRRPLLMKKFSCKPPTPIEREPFGSTTYDN